MYLLRENRKAYIPSSLSLGNVIEHHCVQVIVLPKLAADSVENRKEVGGQEMEKAEVSESYIPCNCIALYYGTIYVLVKSNPLVYKWKAEMQRQKSDLPKDTYNIPGTDQARSPLYFTHVTATYLPKIPAKQIFQPSL